MKLDYIPAWHLWGQNKAIQERQITFTGEAILFWDNLEIRCTSLCSTLPDVRQISEGSQSYRSWSELSFCLCRSQCQPQGRLRDEALLCRLNLLRCGAARCSNMSPSVGQKRCWSRAERESRTNEPKQNERQRFILAIYIYSMTWKSASVSAVLHHSDEYKRVFSPLMSSRLILVLSGHSKRQCQCLSVEWECFCSPGSPNAGKTDPTLNKRAVDTQIREIREQLFSNETVNKPAPLLTFLPSAILKVFRWWYMKLIQLN